MTEVERDEIRLKLVGVGKLITDKKTGDIRDLATVGCIMAVCQAIMDGREMELMELAAGIFTEMNDVPNIGPATTTSH